MNDDFNNASQLEKFIVPVMILLPVLLWYVSFILYQKYYIAKERVNEKVNIEIFGDENGGQMTSGGFGMRPPLPIEDNSKDEVVQYYVVRYNKIVKIFWIWSIVGTTIIIILLNLLKNKPI